MEPRIINNLEMRFVIKLGEERFQQKLVIIQINCKPYRYTYRRTKGKLKRRVVSLK
jgi:hypothetical protein